MTHWVNKTEFELQWEGPDKDDNGLPLIIHSVCAETIKFSSSVSEEGDRQAALNVYVSWTHYYPTEVNCPRCLADPEYQLFLLENTNL